MRLNTFVLTLLFTNLLSVASIPAVLADEPVSFELSLKDHKFQPSEIKAPAGKPIILKIKNQDQTPEEFESSALKVEKIVAGQSEIIVRVRPLAAGRYQFIGEYHQETAAGVLIVE